MKISEYTSILDPSPIAWSHYFWSKKADKGELDGLPKRVQDRPQPETSW
jgi:hypothetical protein